MHKDENHDFSLLIDAKPPVPRYHPAQPPKRLFLDDMLNQTRRCLECGDEFMFESSLKQHYDRKSIVIEVRTEFYSSVNQILYLDQLHDLQGQNDLLQQVSTAASCARAHAKQRANEVRLSHNRAPLGKTVSAGDATA